MKFKTSSSAKKRFRITGSGKIRRQKANKNHLLRYKSKRTRRDARGGHLDAPAELLKQIKRMLTH